MLKTALQIKMYRNVEQLNSSVKIRTEFKTLKSEGVSVTLKPLEAY